MPIWLLIGLGVVALAVCGFFVLITILVAQAVNLMATADINVEPVELNDLPEQGDHIVQYNEWAIRNGFEWEEALMVSIPTSPSWHLALWRRHDAQFLAVIENSEGVSATLGANFDSEIRKSVSTSNSIESKSFPAPPSCMTQVFLDASLDELLELQEVTCQRVSNELGWQVSDLPGDHRDHTIVALRLGAQHIRSLPLWPVVAAASMLTRGARVNKSIRIPEKLKLDRATV